MLWQIQITARTSMGCLGFLIGPLEILDTHKENAFALLWNPEISRIDQKNLDAESPVPAPILYELGHMAIGRVKNAFDIFQEKSVRLAFIHGTQEFTDEISGVSVNVSILVFHPVAILGERLARRAAQDHSFVGRGLLRKQIQNSAIVKLREVVIEDLRVSELTVGPQGITGVRIALYTSDNIKARLFGTDIQTPGSGKQTDTANHDRGGKSMKV